jgi:hypothetical protein
LLIFPLGIRRISGAKRQGRQATNEIYLGTNNVNMYLKRTHQEWSKVDQISRKHFITTIKFFNFVLIDTTCFSGTLNVFVNGVQHSTQTFYSFQALELVMFMFL